MILNNVVGILDIMSLEIGDDVSEFTIKVDWDWGLALFNKAVLNASSVIVITETWSAVHNT